MVSYWPRITPLDPPPPRPITPILHILDLQCPGAEHVIQQVNAAGGWSAPNGWFIFVDGLLFQDDVYQFIHLFSQVLIITPSAATGGFLIQEIYKKAPSLSDVTTFGKGEWFPNAHFNWDQVRFNHRRDLSGVPLIGTIVFADYSSLSKFQILKDFKVDSLSKTTLNLYEMAIQYLNTSYRLVLTDSWGYKLENGTWTGQVGDLLSRKAHVALTPLFVNKIRIDYIDYFERSFNSRVTFNFRPPPLSYVQNVYILPFSMGVWLVSFFFVVLSSGVLWILGRFELKWNDTIQEAYTPGELFMMAIGIVCQQGSNLPVNGISVRIVFLMLLVTVMFVYTSYSAYIVALLQSTSSSIQTLSDLLSSRLELGVHDISYNRYYFENADDPIRKAIYQSKVAPKGKKANWFTFKEGAERMRGLFAFHSEQSPLFQEIQETWSENEKCGLQEIPYLTQITIANALSKDSPFREVFRVTYKLLNERGIKMRFYNRYYTSKPQCTGSGSTFVSVGVVDVYPALMVMVYGYALTLMVFLLEIIYSNWKRRFSIR